MLPTILIKKSFPHPLRFWLNPSLDCWRNHLMHQFLLTIYHHPLWTVGQPVRPRERGKMARLFANNIYAPFSHLTSTDRQALREEGVLAFLALSRSRPRSQTKSMGAWRKKSTKKAKALSAKENNANLRFPSLCPITLDPIPEPKPRSCPGSSSLQS
jgi:hypothetical protein